MRVLITGGSRGIGAACVRAFCERGHRVAFFYRTAGAETVEQLERESKNHTALRVVFGMVNDKDITAVLAMMPTNAVYYFTQASIKRAMPADELMAKALPYGLRGNCYPTVQDALKTAKADSAASDFIFVGGSCFIVADLLTTLEK